MKKEDFHKIQFSKFELHFWLSLREKENIKSMFLICINLIVKSCCDFMEKTGNFQTKIYRKRQHSESEIAENQEWFFL